MKSMLWALTVAALAGAAKAQSVEAAAAGSRAAFEGSLAGFRKPCGRVGYCDVDPNTLQASAPAAPAALPAGAAPFRCDSRKNGYMTGKLHVRFDKGRLVARMRGAFGPGRDIRALGQSRFLNWPQEVELVMDASACEVDPNEPRRLRCDGDAKLYLLAGAGAAPRLVEGPARLEVDDGLSSDWTATLTLFVDGHFVVEKVDFARGLCVR